MRVFAHFVLLMLSFSPTEMIISEFHTESITIEKEKCLDAHQWKDRIILIVSNEKTAKEAEQQLAKFQDQRKSVADRRMVLYTLSETYVKFNAYHKSAPFSECSLQQFQSEFGREFKVLLIGLDGGIKATYDKVVNAEQIFNQIDQMPMRKSELRKK